MTPEEGREVAFVALRVAEQKFGFRAGEEREDLIQEAWIAVLKAAVTYRPTPTGNPFRPWCVSKAAWAILDWYKSQRPLGTRHLTRSQRVESGVRPRIHSLDELIEGSESEQSLGYESSDLWDRSHPDVGGDFGRVESEESVRASVRDAPLTPEERVVVFARYWNGYERRTIGAVGLGVSESRVSQIESAALAKIRPFLDARYDEAIAELMRERAA